MFIIPEPIAVFIIVESTGLNPLPVTTERACCPATSPVAPVPKATTAPATKKKASVPKKVATKPVSKKPEPSILATNVSVVFAMAVEALILLLGYLIITSAA